MKAHRERDVPPLRPVSGAPTPDSIPRSTPVRAGRAASGDKHTAVSARNAVLWVAVVVLVSVWVLRDLVLLVGYSVLLAYALLPVVAAIERPLGWRGPHLPRGAAAAVVMLGLVTIGVWLLALAVPRLAAQAARFAAGAPDSLARVVQGMRAYGVAHGLSAWLDPAVEDARTSVSGLLQNLVGTIAGWAGRGFGGLGQVLGLALVPLLAFYLLAEATAVQLSALRFVPEGAHSEIVRLGGAVDRALRSYVRGQAIVCLVMGFAVGVALALLGSPVALLLGLLVGFAELVPYLGFLVAAVAIALAGLSVSPLHALAGVAAYVVINWVIGTFVTPRVMGRYLKMHPFVVTVSVLAGTQIFGPAGALLALPGAAMLQAVVGELAAPAAPRTGEEAPIPPGSDS
jgi:predicted PurR-regulated permease PerM